MSKEFTRRYQIWTLAPAGQTKRQELANRGSSERIIRHQGLIRPELLHADLSAPIHPLAQSDDPSSLYHYGLPIEIELAGRCIMPNGRSTACMTKKISSQSVDFVYDEKASCYRFKLPEETALGSLLDLDLERIGAFHGSLASQNAEGFRVAVDSECKNMLGNKLALLAAAIRTSADDPGPALRPSVTRLEPDVKSCRFTDHLGMLRKGTIINVSQIDALVKAPIIPPVGAQLVFAGPGRYKAEVTRVFEIGFAVNFSTPIPDCAFSRAIKLLDE